MNPTLIPCFVRTVCGVARTYPANADQALALHELTGARTLEARHVRALSQLGFTFATVADPKARDYGRVDVSTLTLPSNL